LRFPPNNRMINFVDESFSFADLQIELIFQRLLAAGLTVAAFINSWMRFA